MSPPLPQQHFVLRPGWVLVTPTSSHLCSSQVTQGKPGFPGLGLQSLQKPEGISLPPLPQLPTPKLPKAPSQPIASEPSLPVCVPLERVLPG